MTKSLQSPHYNLDNFVRILILVSIDNTLQRLKFNTQSLLFMIYFSLRQTEYKKFSRLSVE